MYRKDELIHMGVKGMKWRKGRKTPITDTVRNLHDERQKQIDDERQKQIDAKRKQAANALSKGISVANVSAKKAKKDEIYKKATSSAIRSGIHVRQLDSKGLKRVQVKAKEPNKLDQEIVKGAKPPKIEFDAPVPGTKKKVKVKKVKY